MVTIITGSTNKPMASEQLREFFQAHKKYSGYLYIGYPIIGSVQGAFPIDALWISKEYGLVIFNLIEGKELKNYEENQDDCANKIEAKLRGYKQLIEKRRLLVEINVITFSPTINCLPDFEASYPLANLENLESTISKFKWVENSNYEKMLSVLQAISTIRKGKKKREINNPKSKGAKLRELEDSIANLDNRQSRAVIETVDGVQRIRGLAGSGKTIVLALKAAYLHAQHPEWKIAITFNTRSLKGQLKQLINTFYIEQTSEEPDWDNLHIIHAWGAPGGGEGNGIYYTYCAVNNVTYNDFLSARNKYGQLDPFDAACKKALSDTSTYPKELYDAILVDEAQDFSPSFLNICYEMLKSPKRLVYAYDELQNLRSQSLPSPEVIFGNLPSGLPRIQFNLSEEGKPQQDIILEKCYRNSRPSLVTAHALGFGIYRETPFNETTGLVQMFEQNSLWNEIGYEVTNGELIDGKKVTLERSSASSPEFLEKHSAIDDLIIFKQFNTKAEQDAWVATEIKNNLENDELRPDDIMVINPNPLTTKKAVAPIRALLYQAEINSHTAGVDTTPDVFFSNDNDSIAFTGIYRAKGNEAAMVYVINSESCYTSYFELATLRNQLFTAITRSKAWVRVLGVGKAMEGLIKEYNTVKDRGFKLEFEYPTKAQRDHMNIVNRDMSQAEKNKVLKSKGNLASLITELENGQIYAEDLGEEQLTKLRKLLLKQEE